jgi:hypothetical protein
MFKAWRWFVVHSNGQYVCWKNRVSSKPFNIWTRNKNNLPSDDILEWQIVLQWFVVLFEIRIWKAFLVMVCSPVKLSSSGSLRNRVVIPGNYSKFEKFPTAEWVWDFHFIFQVHFVILSCTYPRMIIEVPYCAKSTQIGQQNSILCIRISPAAQILGCTVY